MYILVLDVQSIMHYLRTVYFLETLIFTILAAMKKNCSFGFGLILKNYFNLTRGGEVSANMGGLKLHGETPARK